MLRSTMLLFTLLFFLLLYVPSNVYGFDLSLNQYQTRITIVSTQKHKNLILYSTTNARKNKYQHSSQNDINHKNDVVTTKSSTSLDPSNNIVSTMKDRFDRTASQIRHLDEPCIITIDNTQYNVSSWGTNDILYTFFFDLIFY
jgi:uncharacterized secreted protein with C-terminal beta-propeller domain